MRLHKDDLRAIVAAIRWGQPGYEALEDAFMDADEVLEHGNRTAKPEAPNDQVNDQINDGRIIDAVIEKPEAPAPKLEPFAFTDPDPSGCQCRKCATLRGGFILERSRMRVCPSCGDKRCPKADDHANECQKAPAPKPCTHERNDWDPSGNDFICSDCGLWSYDDGETWEPKRPAPAHSGILTGEAYWKNLAESLLIREAELDTRVEELEAQLERLLSLVSDDSLAITFQSMGQYRTFLKSEIRAVLAPGEGREDV